MACYKKIILIFLFSLCLLIFLNSNVYAYSFIDKNGEVYETQYDPQYSGSICQLVTYYEGYYYFMCPAIPNQSGWYWYITSNGMLSNSWIQDSPFEYNTMYCTRIPEGYHVSWSPVIYGSIPEALFYENICYNASPIYDFYGSSLIVKPGMDKEAMNGMAKTINDLVLRLPLYSYFDIFTISLAFMVIALLFVLGVFFIRKLSKKKG